MSKETLFSIIEEQQKGHETDPIYMLGEQIKEIAKREPACIELLEQDLNTPGMQLSDLSDHFQKYADKNHGSKNCFCITPKVAEKLIREFFSIPECAIATTESKASADQYIDLSSFL